MNKILYLIILIIITSSCNTNTDKELIPWIKNNSVVINSDSNGINITDYKNLDSIFKTKKIIGIGEGTHGTSEFNQIRKLLVSHLIVNHDFNTIILEADYGFCKTLNNYITNDEDINIKDSLKRNHHWFYSSTEFLETLIMLKELNTTRENKVQIFGMDIQSIKPEAAIVKSFLQTVDSNNAKLVNYGSFIIENTEIKSISTNTLNIIDSILITNKESIIKLSSFDEWDEALHCIKLLKNTNEFYTDREGDAIKFERIRDKYMYENIEWITNNSNNCKAIILAHNGHISKYKYCGLFNVICNDLSGKYLKEKYGDEYYSMGTIFNKGSFYGQSNIPYYREISTVNEEIPSLPHTFSKANINSFIIDISQTQNLEKPIINYLENKHIYWSSGTTFREKPDKFIPERNFDALIFFNDTKPIDYNFKNAK